MKNYLLLSLAIIGSMPLMAQFHSTIRTGRPGQAIGPYTVGTGVLQLQTGMDRTHIHQADIDQTTTIWLSNTVVRYGIWEKLEISGVFNWEHDRLRSSNRAQQQSGVSDTQIGMRYNLLQRKGSQPGLGIQYRLLLTAQNEPFKREKLGSSFVIATANQLFDQFGLLTNWGIRWGGNGSPPSGTYALNLSFQLSESISGFIEQYGALESGALSTHFDGGVAYLMNNDFQWDISYGWQGEKGIASYFLSLGISWRFHNRA